MEKESEVKTRTEYPSPPAVDENVMDTRRDMVLLVACMIIVGMIMVFLVDIVRMGFGEEPVFIHSTFISDIGDDSGAVKTEL